MNRKRYYIKDTNFGMLLTNIVDENDKLTINHSTNTNVKKVGHYAKQVEPEISYLSGLFFDGKKNKYNGKMLDGTKFNIWINGNNADFETY